MTYWGKEEGDQARLRAGRADALCTVTGRQQEEGQRQLVRWQRHSRAGWQDLMWYGVFTNCPWRAFSQDANLNYPSRPPASVTRSTCTPALEHQAV